MAEDSSFQNQEHLFPTRDHLEICLKYFDELRRDTLSSIVDCRGQISASEVENFAGKLRLWAGNAGVFEKTCKSFDYRLRDSSDIVDEARELLDALIEDTREASAILRGEKVPFEKWPVEDGEDEPEPDTDTEFHLELSSEAGETELGQLKDSLKITLRCLATIATVTEHPAPLDFYACTLQRPDSYKKECKNLVEGKFPDAPNNLKERLVDTMIIRREYLDYREARTKPDQGVPKDSTGETTDSRPNASKFVLLDEDSSMELVESEEETQIDLPPAHLGGPFKCPLCFLDILVLKTKAWRKHVFEDLRPYICTFDRCGAPLNRFDSRRSWFAHEMEHLSKWRCPESCKEYFDTKQALISHLKDFHDWIARAEIPGGIVEACKVLPGGHSKIRCPLCHDETCFSELQDHLGQHQEHLALFALRPQTTQTELEEHSAALEESTFQENRDDSSIASHSGLSQRGESVGGNAELDRDDEGPVQPRMPREHPENSGDLRTNQGVFSGYDRKKTGNENKSHLRTSFVRDEVAGITRPANIAESWALYDFEMHARNCSSCRNPEVVHRAGYQLCDQGSAFARAISKFLYNNDGETYAIAVDKVPQEVRVEIQSGYDKARSLLRAIEHSIRHQRPLLSMERTYLGALQTAAGQRQQSQQQQHLPEAPTATGPTSILLDQAGTSADPKNIKDLEKSQEEPQAGALTKGVSAFSSKEGEGNDKGESEDVKKSKAEYKNDERGRASHKSRDSEGSRRRSGKPESIDDSLPASPDEQAKEATESLERIGLEIAALEHERERLQRERREKLDRERLLCQVRPGTSKMARRSASAEH
ncbi:hypothetical protein HDK90DRAFT_15162 [Phyllosticta capitalensis]|uniref:C2H2-type domain-containing protein n=1 Tax=Phyllosticta capitalensis TaxID=121624 RepID=A0ABR1Z2H4_9PEZI